MISVIYNFATILDISVFKIKYEKKTKDIEKSLSIKKENDDIENNIKDEDNDSQLTKEAK